MKTLIALAAGLVVASSLPVFGQSITWNLGGSSNVTSKGGTKSFTVDGVKVTASAWSYTSGNSNDALEAARIGQWSPGLGVINNEENGDSPWHQLDNYGQNDFILFTFDTLVDVESIRIQASPGPYDQDVSYWVGNTTKSNLEGVTYSGLSALGFSGEQQQTGSSTRNAKDVSINSPSSGVNAILFGPKTGLVTNSKYIDAFKINSITANVVPEPSTALLSLLGVLGVCARRRR